MRSGVFREVEVAFLLFLSLLLLGGAENGDWVKKTGSFATLDGYGVFFYPWYGKWRHWDESGFSPPATWASHFLPDLLNGKWEPEVDLYDSADPKVIRWQLYQMRRAGVSYGIVSWWGKGSYEDAVFERLLDVSGSHLSPHPLMKWCVLYEPEGYGDPSVEELTEQVVYILGKYGERDNYLKVDGKPVIFVYSGGGDGLEYARRWKEVKERLDERGIRFYLVLKEFAGYERVGSWAESWYQYAPAVRFSRTGNYSAFVSPGFWKYRENPALERSVEDFRAALEKLLSAGVKFKLVETWNEWHEGTQVEPYLPGKDVGEKARQRMGEGDVLVRVMREVLARSLDGGGEKSGKRSGRGESWLGYCYEPVLSAEVREVQNRNRSMRRKGRVGVVVEVKGRGFPPNALLPVYLDGKLMKRVRADEQGEVNFILSLSDRFSGTEGGEITSSSRSSSSRGSAAPCLHQILVGTSPLTTPILFLW